MACETHLVIPNCVQVVFVWGRANAKNPSNVMHGIVQAGTSVDVAMADAIMSAWNALFISSGLTAEVGTDAATAQVTVRDLRAESNGIIETTVPGVLGTGIGDLLPAQVAAVLTLRTAKAGRKFRGRLYVPGFCETANNPSGAMIDSTVTALTQYAAGLQEVFSAGQLALGVAHRPTFDPDTCEIVEQGFVTPVTQVVLRNTIWDTQRRRQPQQ